LARGLVRSALSVLRGSTPSVEARRARRIFAGLVPGPPPPFRRGLRDLAELLASEMEEREPEPGWFAPHPVLLVRSAEGAAAPAPILPESRHAISHRCISRSSGRRSGSASTSRARLRLMPG